MRLIFCRYSFVDDVRYSIVGSSWPPPTGNSATPKIVFILLFRAQPRTVNVCWECARQCNIKLSLYSPHPIQTVESAFPARSVRRGPLATACVDIEHDGDLHCEQSDFKCQAGSTRKSCFVSAVRQKKP